MRLLPAQVFTPARLPLGQANVYAPRDAELAIRTAFLMQRTPILFGDFGVGKTTTIRKIAIEFAPEWETFYFEATSHKAFSDFLRRFLETQHYAVTKQVSETTGEAGGSFLSFLALKGQHKEQQVTELLVSSPTDDRVLDIINERPRILIIDELHKAAEPFKECLADFMKSIVNRELTNIRLAIVGTVHQPSELVKYDEGVRRIVQEVRIAPMNYRESSYIVREGMERCELVIEQAVVHRIVELSGGSPSLIHELCLSCANQAIAARSEQVTSVFVDLAVEELLKGRYYQHHELWMRVAERSGDVRWRKQILFAMALIGSEIIATEELSAKLSELLDRPVRSANYTAQMKELQDKHKVISKVTRKHGAEHPLWRFRDPSFRNFISVVWRQEQTKRR